MEVNVAREVAALQRMTPKQLREKYAAVFGEATATGNRTWLVRRIAWRLQALAEGDLSDRARARAAELARDADLRTTAPKHRAVPAAGAASRTVTREAGFAGDGRLPPPGGVISRKYKGSVVQVKVLAGGFEYAGEVYASLSAVAKAVTGSHCNGYLFFRLTGKGSAA
jgi:Protein of unknown function (DUF2924)